MLETLSITHAAAALGIGMLVGLERERKKGRGEDRACAGLRTFAITSVLGYLCMAVGGALLVGFMSLGLSVIIAVAYWKQSGKDPGITSEIALLCVLILGALTHEQPALAIAVGVVLTVLLAHRQRLHRFALEQLTEAEIRDGLILLTVALVVLPLTPNRFIGPFAAINPRTLCTLIVLLMGVGALGHIALRTVGARYGYTLSAIASGFASSTATIAVVGHLARTDRPAVRALAAAAVFSNLATVVQFGLVLATVDLVFLKALWIPMLLGAVTTAVYGSLLLSPWSPSTVPPSTKVGEGAFNLKIAAVVALALTGVTLLSAALLSLLGHKGLLIAAALSGLADAHAATASIASLVKAGQLSLHDIAVPSLIAMSSNTVTKCVLAWFSGGAAFGKYVIPGQLMIIGAMWAGVLLQ
ncbi:MgtC/SapB family protein [Pseudomonas sp. X10]